MSIAALIEAVEAGTATTRDFIDAFGRIPMGNDIEAYNAYNGSLDAAMALHEALLPGWTVRITDFCVDRADPGRWAVSINWQHMEWQPTFTAPGPFSFTAWNNIPSRALLLVDLRAKEAGQ